MATINRQKQLDFSDLFGNEESIILAEYEDSPHFKRLSYTVIIGHGGSNAYVVEYGDNVEQFGSLESAVRRYNEV